MKFIEKNYKIILALLLVSNMLLLSYIILNYTKCSSENCSLDQHSGLMPDLYWRYNTVKYVSEHFSFPREVAALEEGNEDGTPLPGQKARAMWHSPLYYFLAAPIYKTALNINLNPVITLKFLSLFFMLMAALAFILLLREINDNKSFIIYALALFLFFPNHLFTSTTIGEDVLFYLTFILSIYFFINLNRSPTIKNSILLGLILGISLLSRQSSITLSISIFIYAIIKHVKKQYNLRNLLFLSLLISSIIGSYIFIRNYLIFGKLLVTVAEYETNLATFYRLFRGFWGGIYGGSETLKPFLIIAVLLIITLTLYGIFRAYKTRSTLFQTFILIISFVTVLLAINFTCSLLNLVISGRCIGDAALSRYLIPVQPAIAIFTSFALINLEKNRVLSSLIPILVLAIVVLFSLDFLYAFL